MLKINQEKLLILSTVALFLASSVYLFRVSSDYENSAAARNWWAVYFQDASDNNLAFTIDNRGEEKNFHWEVLIDNRKAQEAGFKVPANATKGFLPMVKDAGGKKVTIVVEAGDERQEIYKNISE